MGNIFKCLETRIQMLSILWYIASKGKFFLLCCTEYPIKTQSKWYSFQKPFILIVISTFKVSFYMFFRFTLLDGNSYHLHMLFTNHEVLFNFIVTMIISKWVKDRYTKIILTWAGYFNDCNGLHKTIGDSFIFIQRFKDMPHFSSNLHTT